MKNKSSMLPFVGMALLIGGLAAGIILVKQPQFFRERADTSVSLSISPVSQIQRSGSAFSFRVIMNTNEKSITGFDIKLTFDPNIIQVDSLEKGSGVASFSSPLFSDKIDNTTGSILYGYYTLAAGAVKGSSLEVLKVNARLKSTVQPGTYNLDILPTSLLTSLEDTTSVLQTVNAGHVVINRVGDVNGDNVINLLDINEIIKEYGKSPPTNPATDLDGNGTVNLLDINVVIRNYGT